MILKSEDSLVYWKFNMISKVVSFLTKQLKQKKKLLLKSLFILLLWFSFLPQQNYFSFNEAYAETKSDSEQQTQKEKLASLDTFMQAISNIAFALLWPLIALAWLAMDNTMIYGSFMGLDVSLWNIWQLVRTFANYTLWFLLLAWILWYNLSWQDSMKGIKLPDLLKKILIASVLIQASWFMMMVLVDLSTVLTYSVWWLPYSILNDKTLWSWDDAKMFKMNVDFELWDYAAKADAKWDTSDAIRYYWQITWDQYIAPCETAHVKFWWWNEEQSFAIGRKFIKLDTWYNMVAWYCMYYWALLSYNDFYGDKAALNNEQYGTTLETYKKIIEKDGNESIVKQLVEAWIIFPLSNWKIPYLSEWKSNGGKVPVKEGDEERIFWSQVNSDCKEGRVGFVSSKREEGKDDWECLYSNKESPEITLANIIKKAGSMTWPFAALYSSMSVYSNLDTSDRWLWQKFVITFVNLCFSILLVLPLFALVVVLFARVWLLWIAIALSPFLVLVNVFDSLFSLPDSLKKYLTFDQLVKLLLAPVFISFAVWVSLIFMTVLKNSVWVWTGEQDAYLSKNQTEEFYENLAEISGAEFSWSDMDLLWFIKVKLDSTMLNVSWLLTMFFWLWITWFLLFWAIKQTAIWESIWWTLQSLWETFLSTTPIIPVGKNWLSWSWLTNAPEQIYNEVADAARSKDKERLDSLLNFWKTSTEKKWASYVKKSSLSFNDAFEIDEGAYSDTSAMISRLDAVYKTKGWSSKSGELSGVYSKMIWSADTKEKLEQIVKHANEKWGKDIKIEPTTRKIWGVDYQIKKWTDDKYVLEGWEKPTDAQQ